MQIYTLWERIDEILVIGEFDRNFLLVRQKKITGNVENKLPFVGSLVRNP